MANNENLRPVRSTSEAREKGKKGGIASGKARREKKALKDTLNQLLSMPLKDGATKDLESIKNLSEVGNHNITVQDAIVLKTIQMALKGDTKAMRMMYDLMNTAGATTEATQESDPLSKAFEELENV